MLGILNLNVLIVVLDCVKGTVLIGALVNGLVVDRHCFVDIVVTDLVDKRIEFLMVEHSH